MSVITLPPLSRQQIFDELARFFNQAIRPADLLSKVVTGGPGDIVSLWQDIDDWQAFRQRGLALDSTDCAT